MSPTEWWPWRQTTGPEEVFATIVQTMSSFHFVGRQTTVSSLTLSLLVQQSLLQSRFPCFTTPASETIIKSQALFRRGTDWKSLCTSCLCMILVPRTANFSHWDTVHHVGRRVCQRAITEMVDILNMGTLCSAASLHGRAGDLGLPSTGSALWQGFRPRFFFSTK